MNQNVKKGFKGVNKLSLNIGSSCLLDQFLLLFHDFLKENIFFSNVL